MTPSDLPAQWRLEAQRVRRVGAEGPALTYEACAEDLEHFWRVWREEPLTLEEAAEESGYSYSRLQQMVADWTLPNLGKPGAPRVCRADLPRKPRKAAPTLQSGEPDLASLVLAESL